MEKYYAEGRFIFSGRKNPRTGGIILVYNVDRNALMEIIKQDPFYQNEIVDYEITEVIPTKCDEHFSYFIDQDNYSE